jgi:hypothetical protein
MITSRLKALSKKYPQEGIDNKNAFENKQQLFTGNPNYSLSSIKVSYTVNI